MLLWLLQRVLLGVVVATIPSGDADAIDRVNYAREIRPLLSRNCGPCHGPDEKKREAGLRLDVAQSAIAERGGHRTITPGDPQRSEIVRRIRSSDADEQMPPPSTGKKLSRQEIDLVTALDSSRVRLSRRIGRT